MARRIGDAVRGSFSVFRYYQIAVGQFQISMRETSMLHLTGPGRVVDNVNPQLSPGGSYSHWKFLANFDIDGDELKPAFTDWLNRKILSLSRQPNPPWVFLRGWASRSATPDWNRRLSGRRVVKVLRYLIRGGFPETHITGCHYVGEAWSGDGGEENWRHRSVEVIVSPHQLNPPQPARVGILDPIDLQGRLARDFRIRVSVVVKAGAVVSGALIVLDIWDTTYNLACTYVYDGAGFGVGASGAPNALERMLQGATAIEAGAGLAGRHGQWTHFRTNGHVDVENFVGRAGFSHIEFGGRTRPPGMSEEEFRTTPRSAFGTWLTSPTLRFHYSDSSTLGRLLGRTVVVRLDIPPGFFDGFPGAILTGGSLRKIRGPYQAHFPFVHTPTD